MCSIDSESLQIFHMERMWKKSAGWFRGKRLEGYGEFGTLNIRWSQYRSSSSYSMSSDENRSANVANGKRTKNSIIATVNQIFWLNADFQPVHYFWIWNLQIHYNYFVCNMEIGLGCSHIWTKKSDTCKQFRILLHVDIELYGRTAIW